MLSKESKIGVLENFYGIDYVLFGKPVNKVETCCPLVKEEFLSVKGALLSVYIEMLKLVNYTPKVIEEKINSASLLKNARRSAKIAREQSQKIVVSKKARKNIKESLKTELERDKNIDIPKLVESKIREKAFGLAVDNMLLVKCLSEAKEPEKLNDWEGKIIEDSYKILRDNLVESAIQILYDDTID